MLRKARTQALKDDRPAYRLRPTLPLTPWSATLNSAQKKHEHYIRIEPEKRKCPQHPRKGNAAGINHEATPIARCDYPKLSNIRFFIGTPKLSSILSTALLIGPGPHM